MTKEIFLSGMTADQLSEMIRCATNCGNSIPNPPPRHRTI